MACTVVLGGHNGWLSRHGWVVSGAGLHLTSGLSQNMAGTGHMASFQVWLAHLLCGGKYYGFRSKIALSDTVDHVALGKSQKMIRADNL